MTITERHARTPTPRGLLPAGISLLWPDVHAGIRDLMALEEADRGKILDIQLRKLNALLAHFRLVQPVFRDLSERGASTWVLSTVEDLRTFPVSTKKALARHEPFLARGEQAYRASSTSGSTGTNFRFWQSRSMARARTAAVWYCYALLGVDYFTDRKIRIWGGEPQGSVSSRLLHRTKERLLNFTTLPAYPVDEEKVNTYLDVIRTARPVLVEGYPGTLARVARTGLAHGGRAWDMPVALVTSGEQLTDEQRTIVTQFFSQPIFDRYGSREFGVIAHQRPGVEGWWVPPTRFLIESSPEGELLITDLDNYAFPFIRYAIGDRGTVQPEVGGAQVISSLGGRMHDEIRTPSGRILSGQFWTRFARSVSGIEEYQVVQTAPNRVELRVVANAAFNAEKHSRLVNAFAESGSADMELIVREVGEIPSLGSGKRRYVIGWRG